MLPTLCANTTYIKKKSTLYCHHSCPNRILFVFRSSRNKKIKIKRYLQCIAGNVNLRVTKGPDETVMRMLSVLSRERCFLPGISTPLSAGRIFKSRASWFHVRDLTGSRIYILGSEALLRRGSSSRRLHQREVAIFTQQAAICRLKKNKGPARNRQSCQGATHISCTGRCYRCDTQQAC